MHINKFPSMVEVLQAQVVDPKTTTSRPWTIAGFIIACIVLLLIVVVAVSRHRKRDTVNASMARQTNSDLDAYSEYFDTQEYRSLVPIDGAAQVLCSEDRKSVDGTCAPAFELREEDGCCVFVMEFEEDDKSPTEEALAMLQSVGPEIVKGLATALAVNLTLQLIDHKITSKVTGRVTRRLAADMVGYFTGKISSRIARRLASIMVRVGSSPLGWAFAAFDMMSLALDIADPDGYNNFLSNKIIENTRNVIEVVHKESMVNLGEDYPMFFRLDLAFPTAFAAAREKLIEDHITPCTVEQLLFAHADAFANVDVESASLPPEVDDAISECFEELWECRPLACRWIALEDESGMQPLDAPSQKLIDKLEQNVTTFTTKEVDEFELPVDLKSTNYVTVNGKKYFPRSRYDASKPFSSHSARDAQFLNILKECINQKENHPGIDLRDMVQLYGSASTATRIGVSLSERGVSWWNAKHRMDWLRYHDVFENLAAPDDYVPADVALFTRRYRVLDESVLDQDLDHPTMIEKMLPEKWPLALPIGFLVSFCEKEKHVGLLGSDIRADGTQLNPYDHGVRFNIESGACKYTQQFCKGRLGMEFHGPLDQGGTEEKPYITDCFLPPGTQALELIFGTTFTRRMIRSTARLSQIKFNVSRQTRTVPRTGQCIVGEICGRDAHCAQGNRCLRNEEGAMACSEHKCKPGGMMIRGRQYDECPRSNQECRQVSATVAGETKLIYTCVPK